MAKALAMAMEMAMAQRKNPFNKQSKPWADKTVKRLKKHAAGFGMSVHRDGVSGRVSQFYSPAEYLAEKFKEAALDKDRLPRNTKVVYEKDHEKTEPMTFRYRAVMQRTEKGLRVSVEGKPMWLPKEHVKFLPGNKIKMPWWLAKSRGLVWPKRP